MISGAEGVIRIHKATVGSNPRAHESPRTPKEKTGHKAEEVRGASEKLKALEARQEQYNRLMAMCEKKFGPAVCNR